MDQTQRVALITGGARRVGRAIVERLAAAGFDVAFTYRQSREQAVELVGRIESTGRKAVAIKADFESCKAACSHVATQFNAAFSRLDVLINNASLFEPSSLKAATPDQSRRFWAVHVEAPLLLCRQFEPALRQSRGHVINMVDLLAERPWPEYLVYCASKGALLTLTLGLAKELAPDVAVNGIAPGVVQWPDDYPAQDRQRYLRRVPLGRAGTPQEVAELVHFLCTAGSYITGQIIRLDGGRSIT